MRMRRVLVTDR